MSPATEDVPLDPSEIFNAEEEYDREDAQRDNGSGFELELLGRFCDSFVVVVG